MGIEQIQLAKTKALLPAFQFNWSQMESNPGPQIALWRNHEKNTPRVR